MPPALTAPQRLQPVDHLITPYANALLALVIDINWSNTSMSLILSEPNEPQRHALIDSWLTHRFADLDRISLMVRCSLTSAPLKLSGCSKQYKYLILTII